MARANKYASVNFNDIYEKKPSPGSSSPSPPLPSSSSPLAAAAHLHKPQFSAVTRSNGRMLVLSRPSPKPQPPPSAPSQPAARAQSRPSQQQQTASEPDPISLRPLGRTGSGPTLSLPVPPITQEPLRSPKPGRFVPPHLRPGFVARKDSPGPEKLPGSRSGESDRGAGQFGLHNRYGEGGRPKSGGHERRSTGAAEVDRVNNRPSSGGNRSSSSGWYSSCSSF